MSDEHVMVKESTKISETVIKPLFIYVFLTLAC